MDARPANRDPWILTGTQGELRCGSLSGIIDVTRPDVGLQSVNLNGQALPGHLVGVRRFAESPSHESDSNWPLSLRDAYVRGNDLVASYEPTDDWPFAVQVYWTADPLRGVDDLLASLSLLISVQTPMLDTWPRISVSSQLRCQSLRQVVPLGTAELRANQSIQSTSSACYVIHHLTGVPMTYVEIMPPSDFHELKVRKTTSDGLRAEWELFADFLEKGVIRKAQLQAAFVPRQGDRQRALQCYAAMERRPLPLTT